MGINWEQGTLGWKGLIFRFPGPAAVASAQYSMCLVDPQILCLGSGPQTFATDRDSDSGRGEPSSPFHQV